MKGKSLGGLIVLNVVLLAALALFSLLGPQQVHAQLGAQQGGDYLMLGYNPAGRQPWDAIIITDLNSGKMLAVRYDTSRKRFDLRGYHDISADVKRAMGQ